MAYNPDAIKRFIKAVDDVKNAYICGVCSEMCVNPVTLSACYHLICAAHLDTLKTCPTCETPVKDPGYFTDDKLELCIQSVVRLSGIVHDHGSQSAAIPSTTKITVSKKGKDIHTKENQSLSQPSNVEKRKVTKKSVETVKNNANISLTSIGSSKTKVTEKRNTKGETPLHIACRVGQIEKVSVLLQQGANTNTKDNAGWTPLHEVVQNGRLDLVKLLLQYNTLIDVPGQGNETPLHEAVRYKHKDIAVVLVKNGADINIRNCKGESPLQLASNDMKKAMLSESNIISQSINIEHISQFHYQLDIEHIRIHSTSQLRNVQNKLKSLSKHHTNLNIEEKFTKKVTHLIVDADNGECISSLEILQAIGSSIWVLSANWVMNSTDEKLEPFSEYEVVIGSAQYEGPKRSRINKYKLLPGLFTGCHFYLHNFNSAYEISKRLAVNKTTLSKLIVDAGGIVLRRVPNPESIPESEKLVPYHAEPGSKLTICSHYIIFKDMYEPQYNMQHLKALPIAWLIECIEKYQLCDP